MAQVAPPLERGEVVALAIEEFGTPTDAELA